MTSRGIRNNNPGNIERTSTQWRGMSADQRGDDRFVIFDRPEWGIRAMTRLLKNYRLHHQLKTIAEVITRWAPPSENDTESYIRSVERRAGISRSEVLSEDIGTTIALLDAIIWHENGEQPYDISQLRAGVLLEEILV